MFPFVEKIDPLPLTWNAFNYFPALFNAFWKVDFSMWDVSTHWLGKLLRKWSNRDKSDRDRSIFFNTLYKLCLQYYTYFFEIHNSLLQLCMLASFWRNLVKPSFVFPALLFLNFLTPFRSVPEKTLLILQAGKLGAIAYTLGYSYKLF